MKTRLILPPVGKIYKTLEEISGAIFRITIGVILIPHGAQKLFGWFGGSFESTANFFASVGYPAPEVLTSIVGSLEFFGGICLIIGFFTRPFAFAIFVFMVLAVQFHMKNGFFWMEHGFEYPLLLAVSALFVFIRGGGQHSLDAKIGKEF